MTVNDVLRFGIEPALSLLPPHMDTKPARAMLIAIGSQESDFIYRAQVRGPALGWWQFEAFGGVAGVLRHRTTRHLAEAAIQRLTYIPVIEYVHGAIEHNDVLAAVFARLLLWTVPEPLPGVTQADEAWRQYLSAWRPGRPHPERWEARYASAWRAVA